MSRLLVLVTALHVLTGALAEKETIDALDMEYLDLSKILSIPVIASEVEAEVPSMIGMVTVPAAPPRWDLGTAETSTVRPSIATEEPTTTKKIQKTPNHPLLRTYRQPKPSTRIRGNRSNGDDSHALDMDYLDERRVHHRKRHRSSSITTTTTTTATTTTVMEIPTTSDFILSATDPLIITSEATTDIPIRPTTRQFSKIRTVIPIMQTYSDAEPVDLKMLPSTFGQFIPLAPPVSLQASRFQGTPVLKTVLRPHLIKGHYGQADKVEYVPYRYVALSSAASSTNGASSYFSRSQPLVLPSVLGH